MKLDLIIDGNYLLMKDVFILYELKTLHKDLLTLLKNDLDALYKMYPWDNIYFVSDSKRYWRKDIYPDYKSNREKDDKIDWDFVFNEFEIFKESFKNNIKINHLEFDKAEGDDIIAYVTKKNNEKGTSNIIIASDSDLHQLLGFDIHSEWMNIVYNYKFSDERTFFPLNYNMFISELSNNQSNTLFDMNDQQDFFELIDHLETKTKTKEISTEKLLFRKLVSGDKNDCISSVYQTLTKTGKIRGIGEKGAESIYDIYKESYKETILFESNDFLNNAVDIIAFNKKIDPNDIETLTKIKRALKRNRGLIMLDENYLPTNLKNEFDEKIIIR